MGRNYDSDNSFFNDIKQNLNENSFHEQILEKNKVHYNQQVVHHNSSIVDNLLNQRQNSNDKI